MSDNSQLELIREAANRPPYKQMVYVNAGQLLAEIEREYLPRPRFEDGEPVKEGDTICIDGHLPLKVYSWSIRNDGLTVFSCPTSHRSIKTGERVKRPEPEVLDADGVPIRVGDHIWHTPGVHYDGIEYVVTRVTETRVSYRNAEGEFPSGNCLNEYASSNITHKQPDSLERIEEEMHGLLRGYSFEYKVFELIDRMIKVMERDHER